MINEGILFDIEDFEQSSPTDAESIQIDYEKIEDAYYNALKRVELEKEDVNRVSVSSDSDVVEFGSDTDARYYTLGDVDAPTKCTQQQTLYLLDIRNILLIILLFYFCVTIYSKLKTTLINYTR